jgi:hypothetical protein
MPDHFHLVELFDCFAAIFVPWIFTRQALGPSHSFSRFWLGLVDSVRREWGQNNCSTIGSGIFEVNSASREWVR